MLLWPNCSSPSSLPFPTAASNRQTDRWRGIIFTIYHLFYLYLSHLHLHSFLPSLPYSETFIPSSFSFLSWFTLFTIPSCFSLYFGDPFSQDIQDGNGWSCPRHLLSCAREERRETRLLLEGELLACLHLTLAAWKQWGPQSVKWMCLHENLQHSIALEARFPAAVCCCFSIPVPQREAWTSFHQIGNKRNNQ